MEISPKIQPIDKIADSVQRQKKAGKTVVHCHGEFDLLHLGHTRYFKAAKKKGDFLVVTLTPDRYIAKGPGRPVFNEDLRAEAIANLEFVDSVGINRWPTAVETLKTIKPDIYVKGSEYLNKVDTTGRLELEKKVIESLGGRMEFSHEIVFSSSKLLNNHFDVFTKESQPFLSSLAKRCDAMEMIEFIDQLKSMRILLIGEGIVDRHVLVSRNNDSEKTGYADQSYGVPKGLLAGSQLFDGLGVGIDVVSLVPKDRSEESLKSTNESYVFESPTLSHPHHTHYLNNEDGHFEYTIAAQPNQPISSELEANICQTLSKGADSYDCIIVFDQRLGLFTPKICELLSRSANSLTIVSSGRNLPYLNQFSNIDLLCLTVDSWEGNDSDFEMLIRKMAFRKDSTDQIVLTGNKGLVFLEGNSFSSFPRFTDDSVQFHMDDKGAIVASLIAPLKTLNMDRDWLKLIGNALVSMVDGSKSRPYQFDKLLFDKFLIALLNR